MARKTKKTALTPEERLQAALVPVGVQPYPVPGNWCWTYAPVLFSIEYGKGLSTKQLSNVGYPVFGANGQIGFYSEYMYDESQALMSCRGAYSGTMNKSLPNSFVTSNSLVIQGKKFAFSPEYICDLFSALDISPLVSGTAQPQITVQSFGKYPVPLPPLPEQQRIVAQIESLFAKLDEAKEKVQAALDSFEPRKAAVLHRAFSGELTAGWRKEQGIGKETWIRVPLIDILREKPRNGYSPSPVSYQTETKSMTLSAVTSGVFMPEYYKYIDADIPVDSYLWLEPGDVLIQRANSLDKVGSSALYTGDYHEFIYPDLMMKLRLKENIVNQFVAYQLKTDEVMTYIRANATGTAGNMPKINQKTVSHIPIVLPAVDEQTEIVRILDAFFEQEVQAKAQAEAALEAIDTMKKPILAKAFRGELGTNDPGEESALELLKQSLDTDR